MRKYILVILAIALLVMPSCQRSTQLTDEQNTVIEAELKGQVDGILSAINRLDANGLSDYISEENFISFNSMVTSFPSRNIWIDSVSHWFSMRERQQVELVDLQITVMTPEWAHITLKTNWDIVWKNGEQVKSTDIATSLWKKEPAGWKQTLMHESWAEIK